MYVYVCVCMCVCMFHRSLCRANCVSVKKGGSVYRHISFLALTCPHSASSICWDCTEFSRMARLIIPTFVLCISAIAFAFEANNTRMFGHNLSNYTAQSAGQKIARSVVSFGGISRKSLKSWLPCAFLKILVWFFNGLISQQGGVKININHSLLVNRDKRLKFLCLSDHVSWFSW